MSGFALLFIRKNLSVCFVFKKKTNRLPFQSADYSYWPLPCASGSAASYWAVPDAQNQSDRMEVRLLLGCQCFQPEEKFMHKSRKGNACKC